MKAVVYDAAVLVAAERNDRRMWADHRVRLELGIVPMVPAPVVAQVSRSTKQVQLGRLLTGCDIIPFDERAAHAVGRLLGATKTSDVIDGAVVEVAARQRADVVVTSDVADLSRLVTAAGARVRVERL